MSSRIWLINICVAAVAIFFGIKAYTVWSAGEKGLPQVREVRKALSEPRKKVVKRKMAPESAYEVIATENLFWQDRREFVPEKGDPKPAAKPAKPKVASRLQRRLESALKEMVLYGVLITNGNKEALIRGVAKETTKGRVASRTKGRVASRTKGRVASRKAGSVGLVKEKWVKVGGEVGEFEVKDIGEDSVLLGAGGNEYRILLYDKERPKKRTAVAKEERPTVITVGLKGKGGVEVVKTPPKRKASKPKVSEKKKPPRPIVKARKAPSREIRRNTRQR